MFLLLSVAFVSGQRGVDRVSEAGEKLGIRPEVKYTIDGTKLLGLKRDLMAARKEYEKAVLNNPNYAPARYSLAKSLMNAEADSAMLHARVAYLSDTTNYWYLSTYAQSVLAKEKFDEAMVLYRKLLVLDPQDLNAYRILAILHQHKNEPHTAISLLDSAELKVGRNSYLMGLKRSMLVSTKQFERAIREAKEMVQQEPYSAEYRVALAELYVTTEQYRLAEEQYGEAMMIDSTRLETLLTWGNYLERTKRETEYLEVLRRIMQSEEIDLDNKVILLKEIFGNKELLAREYIRVGDLLRTLLVRYPGSPVLVEMQSDYLLAGGMIEDAVTWLKSHLDEVPPVLSYYVTVIDIESYLQRTDSVELYVTRALKSFPNVKDLRYKMATTYTRQGRYSEAIECYSKELKGATDSLAGSIWGIIGDLHHQISLVEAKEGKAKEAERSMKKCYSSYNKSLKLDPKNIMVLNNYAYFLSESGGDLKLALEMSKLSNELERGNPTFLDTHAWILYRMGEYAEAKVIMRQAISFDNSKNGEIALHYGEILAVLGEETMANFYWERALQWGMSKEEVARSRERAAAVLKKSEK